jgi:spore germination protein GerM
MLKIKLVLIILGLIFLFPQTIRADKADIYYYTIHDDGSLTWQTKHIDIAHTKDLNYKSFQIFKEFFNSSNPFIISDAKLLSSIIDRNTGELVLDISSGINDYGGNYYEAILINQILKTAFAIDEVKSVTLLIEGKQSELSEGRIISKESKLIDIQK